MSYFDNLVMYHLMNIYFIIRITDHLKQNSDSDFEITRFISTLYILNSYSSTHVLRPNKKISVFWGD